MTEGANLDDLEGIGSEDEPHEAAQRESLARIESFVRALRIQELLDASGVTSPVWLGLTTSAPERKFLETLSKNTARALVVELENIGATGNPEAADVDAIAHYAQRYTAELEKVLLPIRERLLGLLIGDDRQPWVRHLVYCCKSLGIRTVLVPYGSLGPEGVVTPPASADSGGTPEVAPWKQPSGYARADGVVDSPITDCLFAYTEADRATWIRLGYPKNRVHCLQIPQDEVLAVANSEGIGKSLRRLISPRLFLASKRLSATLEKQSSNASNLFDPSYKKTFFSGSVSPLPHSGLIAYHREIDPGSAYVPAMLGFRRLCVPSNFESAQDADAFAVWGGLGGEHRKARLKRWAKRLKRPCLLLEDGLFRSVEIGLSGTPSLSIMLDDKRAYYDATGPSRLEDLLNSSRQFTDEQLKRAETCMAAIAQHRLSKYNHAPDRPLPFGPDAVLVVDQRKGDLSVERGLGSEASFHQMLLAARHENPNRTVLIKRHPDAMSGGKQSYFSNPYLEGLGALPNTHLIDYEVNPHALFDCCTTVYVVTSGMGFEAALRGLRVRCFGMPFYAGWGISFDEVTLPRRTQRRTLAEVFYAACILHSRYYDPTAQAPCELEAVIEYLAKARDALEHRTG